jgi:hypothetical protein
VFWPRSLRRSLPGIVASVMMLSGVLLFLAGPMLPVWAGGGHTDRLLQGDTVVSVDPPDVVITMGSTVSVDIRVEDVTDLYYALVVVIFDPAVLEVVDADSSTAGVQIEPGAFLSAGGTAEYNDVIQEDGEIYFGQAADDDPVSGSGVLAIITFRGKAAGSSQIVFDEDYFWLGDEGLDPIDASVEDGIVIVVSGAVPPTSSTATATEATTATTTPTPGSSPVGTPTPVSKPTFTPVPTSVPGQTATPIPTRTPVPTPQPTSVVQSRTMQIWPERRIGVASRLREGATSYADTEVLPFGTFSPSPGETVEARTYLDFPIGVFPLGTDVKRATLYVYVDGVSGTGEGILGVHRVLQPWDEAGWGGVPAAWPAFLASPVAVAEFNLDVEHVMLPGVRSGPRLARVVPDSPLPTPTFPSSGLPTPTATAVPTTKPTATLAATQTPVPTKSPTLPTSMPTSTPVLPPAALTFALDEMAGRWITWDITALVRAWLADQVDDYGLALALAPDSDGGTESVGGVLLARWLAIDDPDTVPYLIADIDIYPVTPTPTPAPLLPVAGSSAGWGWGGAVVSLLGAVLLVIGLGLAVRRKAGL